MARVGPTLALIRPETGESADMPRVWALMTIPTARSRQQVAHDGHEQPRDA